jgi:hypothetical protein
MAEQQLRLILFLIGGARITNTNIFSAANYSGIRKSQPRNPGLFDCDHFLALNTASGQIM